MFQVPKHAKWALWLLALALLCFVASQIPAIRKHLFWSKDEQVQGEEKG